MSIRFDEIVQFFLTVDIQKVLSHLASMSSTDQNTPSPTTVNLVVRILADANDWVEMAPLQTRLGRNALAVEACIELGLVESRSRRVGTRGGRRRAVRLTTAGWTVHRTLQEAPAAIEKTAAA